MELQQLKGYATRAKLGASDERDETMQTETLTQFLLKPRSKHGEAAFGVLLTYVLVFAGVLIVGALSGEGQFGVRSVLMMVFLTLAPLISFAGLAAQGSAAFTGLALIIYVCLWIFAMRRFSGLVLRVAVVILMSCWMIFGIWASTQVY